ncbi:MAG: MucR family transcriptional regulator [Caulobacter sp.]|nr:MucR family transcriptional regulator [Caulobacter sp.]
MAEPTDADTRELLDHTTEIVAAYVRRNNLAPSDLPRLIETVHATLGEIATGKTATQEAAPLKPAVPIRRSVTPDYLISLEDGQRYKSLKRHLSTKYGMTPDEYRAKWGLPKDYPMVAPNYAATRSALAKASGLGQGGRKPAKRRAKKTG